MLFEALALLFFSITFSKELNVEREAETARARASLYSLVAYMVGKEPSETFLEELNTPAFRDAAEDLGLSPLPLLTSEEAEAYTQEIKSEYARLFLVPGTPLHPYESVQRGEARLWGEFTVQVQQAYHDAGFTLSPETNQIPDHLAVELEFVSHLANEEADRWEESLIEEAKALKERQKHFLEEHLGAWAVQFVSLLKQETSHTYFTFLAEMLETVVESDLSLFNITLEKS